MERKNKHPLVSLFFIILFFCVLSLPFSRALAMEVKLLGLSDNPSLGDYIKYIFNVGVSLAGILCLISFTIGAITFMASAGNTGLAGEGKERMKSSILGLVLSVGAALLLGTINPVFTTPLVLNQLPGTSGVFLVNNGTKSAADQSYPDTSSIEQQGFNTLQYLCDNNNGPNLLVWSYQNTGLTNPQQSSVHSISCGGQFGLANVKSFKWAKESPGVYYCVGGCSGNMCKEGMSDAINSSQNSIDASFAGKIQGVRIVNDFSDPANPIYYGTILHDTSDLTKGGGCTYPLINEGQNSVCLPVDDPNFSANAANIFILNKNPIANDGITFYSKSTGWNTNPATAGYKNLASSNINPDKSLDPSILCYQWGNVAQPAAYENRCNSSCPSSSSNSNPSNPSTGAPTCSANGCDTFQHCPGSIKFGGNYLVALYSQDVIDINAQYCETFTGDVPNLNVDGIVNEGSGVIDEIYVIPTK